MLEYGRKARRNRIRNVNRSRFAPRCGELCDSSGGAMRRCYWSGEAEAIIQPSCRNRIVSQAPHRIICVSRAPETGHTLAHSEAVGIEVDLAKTPRETTHRARTKFGPWSRTRLCVTPPGFFGHRGRIFPPLPRWVTFFRPSGTLRIGAGAGRYWMIAALWRLDIWEKF